MDSTNNNSANNEIICKDINSINFNDIFNKIIGKKNGSTYNGITKKCMPRWMGWKYIDILRNNNISIKDLNANISEDKIHLDALDVMALNYYIIKILNNLSKN